MQAMDYIVVKNAVEGAGAAFRCVARLQPADGKGGKVFPPTYEGGRYAYEKRRIAGGDGNGDIVDCVLLDSVQSQANRMEEALQDAIDEGRLALPLIEVDFSGVEDLRKPVPKITSLQAPHRLADAILRDSRLEDGSSFMESEYAKQWSRSTLQNATAVFRLCPTALVFGLWGSPEKPGGLGAKFARAIASEIVGINVVRQENRDDKRRGFRIDPLEISSHIKIKTDESGWEVSKKQDDKKALRPSEINHGNIVFDSPNTGVTFEYAQQSIVVSLPALRRLKFPLDGGSPKPDINAAGRTVLASLALCAAALAMERGLDLRSRCLLHPENAPEWELIGAPGAEPQRFAVDSTSAIAILNDAIEAAKKLGLSWNEEPILLTPSGQLAKLVRLSQEYAATKGEEGEA